jgi:hypothetical protein
VRGVDESERGEKRTEIRLLISGKPHPSFIMYAWMIGEIEAKR